MDGVKAFVDAVEELGGEIHLDECVIDVREPSGEQLHAASVLRDGEIPLLEITVLPVEHHVPGSPIGEEVVTDPSPELVRGGGTDDMVSKGIGESGVNPENEMGVKFRGGGVSVGRQWVLDEVGDAVVDQDHEEERLPLMIVVVIGIEEKFDVVLNAIAEDGMWRRGGRGRRQR